MSFSKFVFLFFALFSINAKAQQRFTISGNIKSNRTNNAIAGATVKLANSNVSVMADSIGNYLLTLNAGKYNFEVSAVGMKTMVKTIVVSANLTTDFLLLEDENNLSEVVISTVRNERSLASTQMGAERMSMKMVNKIPLIFGERDILKAIQLLPGIKSAGEGGSGIFVRGGSADQNLILMDDVPVYNAAHLFGFFSTFNPEAVQDLTVYKTGMPAKYGGRLSAVLDIKMNSGNDTSFSASGGVGLISSKLTLQGPIQKNKSSFTISGRRTYVDALLAFSSDSTINQNTMYFYDFNAKADFRLNENNKLSFTGYLGNDKLGLSDTFGLTWGNALASAQWQHLFSQRFNATTTAYVTNYQNRVEVNSGTTNVQMLSTINDISIKQDFLWLLNPQNTIKFGFNSIYHTVKPGQITADETSNYNSTNYQNRYSLENALYATSDWQLTKKLNLGVGLRLSAFSILGKGDFLNVGANGQILDTTSYASGEVVKTYLNLEPRLALSYLLNEKSSVKASYVRNTQNMHMLSNSTSNRPTDRWLSSTNMIKPEISDQVSMGYYRNLFDNKFELNVESYYKTMQNQIDYRDGADVFDADAVETQLLYGRGRAYGLEFLFKKKTGDFTGWISYTLAKTERQIDGINNNNWYNARQDRTHEIAVVSSYELNKRWSLSAAWIYYTGDAITFPSGKYNMDGQSFFYYTDRNAYRMPSYHRLDLGATFKLKQKKNYSSELAFSLYNAYGRKNPYSITFREAENDPSVTEAVRTTLFQYLPSISYNFKFL